MNTLLTTLYILVFVVGLLLNLCGMKCLVHNWKKLRIITILVLNLEVADMLYLLTHPFLVYYINKNDWIFGKGFCLVARFCFYLNLYGSIGFLTCISVYRYLAVVHPMRTMGRLATTHSVVISVVMWILASVISFPDLSFPKYSENSSACYDTTDSDNVEKYLTYSLCWTFIGFCIPFIDGSYEAVSGWTPSSSNQELSDIRITLQKETFCFNLNLYGSIGFLTCICVYRYLAVVHPMKVMGKLTTTLSVVISVLVWILVNVESSPDMLFPKHSGNKTERCFDTTSSKNVTAYLNYSLSWTFFGFCIPFAIIVGCYGHVTVVVCRSDTIKNVTKQIFKLMVFLILLFSLCYAPYHVFKNLNLYSRVLKNLSKCAAWDSGVYVARQASRGVVSLNSALNPLVTYFSAFAIFNCQHHNSILTIYCNHYS
uniref:Si:dkey-78k11.9 n=1 Tax=Poecilia latipinna TaxID=48699 RepID=A0A3B3W2E2_9TELE